MSEVLVIEGIQIDPEIARLSREGTSEDRILGMQFSHDLWQIMQKYEGKVINMMKYGAIVSMLSTLLINRDLEEYGSRVFAKVFEEMGKRGKE